MLWRLYANSVHANRLQALLETESIDINAAEPQQPLPAFTSQHAHPSAPGEASLRRRALYAMPLLFQPFSARYRLRRYAVRLFRQTLSQLV